MQEWQKHIRHLRLAGQPDPAPRRGVMRRLIYIARHDPEAFLGITCLALFVIAPLFLGGAP